MPEALRQFAPEFARTAPLIEAPALAVVVNDNHIAPALRTAEPRGFEIPARIWWTMVACYGVLLAALLAATGGAFATFMIVISAGYVAMYFGTARVMVRQSLPQPRSPLDRTGGKLQTLYGLLSETEVVAQMLTVPATVAFFGIAVLVIRIAVG